LSSTFIASENSFNNVLIFLFLFNTTSLSVFSKLLFSYLSYRRINEYINSSKDSSNIFSYDNSPLPYTADTNSARLDFNCNILLYCLYSFNIIIYAIYLYGIPIMSISKYLQFIGFGLFGKSSIYVEKYLQV